MPCALVYGLLPVAMFAGGAWQGALVMLLFGLGTIVNFAAAACMLEAPTGSEEQFEVGGTGGTGGGAVGAPVPAPEAGASGLEGLEGVAGGLGAGGLFA